jgi:NAD+ synthase
MPLSIALAQCNFTVGDIPGNIAKVTAAHKKATENKADLVVFSEMAVTGYPPEDLVLRKRFQELAVKALDTLAALTEKGPAILVGGLWREKEAIYNAAFLMDEGRIIHCQPKHHLPNYGVFDEKRVFLNGPVPQPVQWHGLKLGILVCEDMWQPDVAAKLKNKGAEILISINASPYELGKEKQRWMVAEDRIRETGLPILYVNQIGGQDELVFDGRSFIANQKGEIITRLSGFEEDFAVSVWDKKDAGWNAAPGIMQPSLNDEATIYHAMVVGLRDYVEKNRFPGVVLGLSGGIDSAITAAVAVDALGKERVRAVMLPSPYTSNESLEDAAECAARLGIRLDSVSIEPAMAVLQDMLSPLFAGKPEDTTEENIQSRLRGNILMSISNKEGLLVLTTGNKSEMSVGYATLYGDMCGGFSVLKDVYKTTIYKVVSWRNQKNEVIPSRIITKAPSAELKPNQTDQDTLPAYEMLDAILLRLIEQQLSVEEIVTQGYPRETVERVARMLYAAEYKRRQAPPGVKVTGMSFGRDRRYPITSGWRG